MFVARVQDFGLNGQYRNHETSGNSEENITGETNVDDDFNIYPNPTHEILNVECNFSNAEIHITDLLGNEIIRIPVSGNRTQIDVRKLDNGIYFLRIELPDKIFIKKFSVIK